jgi:AcrR family transcriptional regulator
MPRPSQETAILDAALHCFATSGFDATRIKHIAEAAGVSEGALYRHYDSKEAIAQALFHHHMQRYVQQLQDIVNEEAPVEQRLREIITDSLAMYRANPDAIAFILLERPRLMGTLPPDMPYPIALVEALIREGQLQGVLRSGTPLLLASIFLGCLLRPIIVSRSGLHPALDLLRDTQDDQVIGDAAWAAVARSPYQIA